MKKRLTGIVFLTLGICEIVFFLIVYHSNRSLLETIRILKQAGHLTVPNSHILPALDQLGSAFLGSLFLMSTAGIFVTIGVCICAAFYCLLRSGTNPQKPAWLFPFSGALVAVLVLGSLFSNPSVFLRTRDYVLLPNAPGKAMNRFYYTYTLYAAHAITPPLQKQVKTCWIAPSLLTEGRKLNLLLSRFGWFDIPNKNHTDFEFAKSEKGSLALRYKGKRCIKVPLDTFYENPLPYLHQYSKYADSKAFIRFLCLFGLFAALPVLGVGGLFLTGLLLFIIVLPKKKALYLSGVLVPVTVFLVLLYLTLVDPPNQPEEVGRMLASDQSKSRIEALRAVCREAYDIWCFPEYCRKAVNSPVTAEKYWLANAFSVSGSKKGIPHLKKMVHDESINVQTAAINALADLSCDSATMDVFQRKVINSRQWYVQQAAFNAIQQCR